MPRKKSFDEEQVLNKAMNLFWKQGFAATSIQDLVHHLEINRASLYDTFGDKDQLFKKSFALYRNQSISRIGDLFQHEPDVKKGFSQLFQKAVEVALNDPNKKGCFAVNTTTELVPNDDICLDVLTRNRLEFENLFYDYLKQGQTNGQISNSKDLKALASFLFVTYNGLLVVSKIQNNSKELANSVNLALSLLD